jgi:ornithine cyclodeaminase
LRYLTNNDIAATVTMKEAIEAVRSGFSAFSSGETVSPLRTAIILPGLGNVLTMVVYLPREKTTTVKVVTLYPGNPARGLPMLEALAQVYDGETGTPLAIIDGIGLTRLRTAAASGLATELLSRPESRTVAIIGAGVQGASQLEAVCAVRAIEEAWAFDIDAGRLAAFCERMTRELQLPVRPAASAMEAVWAADVICAATTAPDPVIPDAAIRPGAHVNAIGAYRPQARELPGELIRRSRLFVDSVEACLEEAGDIIIPLKEGLITRGHILGEIGQLADGVVRGRLADDDITIFKSVGVAVQDGAVATVVARKAERLGKGIVL